MVTPIELITAVIDGMAARGFGRIVNITSSPVLAPIGGLDLSSGARAGLTAFLGGVLPRGRRPQRDDQQPPARPHGYRTAAVRLRAAKPTRPAST